MELASRATILTPSLTLSIDSKAKAMKSEGIDVCGFGAGEPDFDTPRNVVDAGIDALNKGFTHYGPSAGLPLLRQTIADEVSKTRGVKVTPEEVVVVPGGKPII